MSHHASKESFFSFSIRFLEQMLGTDLLRQLKDVVCVCV